MKWKKWLENWDMTSLRISTSFLEMEWQPQNADKDAAWELYVEMLTRVATQELKLEEGDEQAALASIYDLFDLTREISKKYKRDCIEFTKIAVVMLNQVIRPFTSKWHKNLARDPKMQRKFRMELLELQKKLRIYTQMLGEMAGVETMQDLTGLSIMEEQQEPAMTCLSVAELSSTRDKEG